MDSTTYVIRARQVIAGWEQGGLTGRAEDNLRLIGDTIARLEQIIAERPSRAGTLTALIARYRAIADRVKASAN